MLERIQTKTLQKEEILKDKNNRLKEKPKTKMETVVYDDGCVGENKWILEEAQRIICTET